MLLCPALLSTVSRHYSFQSLPSPSMISFGLLRWRGGKASVCQCRRHGFDPWIRKIPWRRKWQPTPVFLPGKSHGQRSMVRYSPWVHRVKVLNFGEVKFTNFTFPWIVLLLCLCSCDVAQVMSFSLQPHELVACEAPPSMGFSR